MAVSEGVTSVDDGHRHGYSADLNGNGNTHRADGHTHAIVKWKVLKGPNGHIHKIK